MTYYGKQRMESFKRAMFAAKQIGTEPQEQRPSQDAALQDLAWLAWLPRPMANGSQLAS